MGRNVIQGCFSGGSLGRDGALGFDRFVIGLDLPVDGRFAAH
jgi:hypothetical protein